ncbi:MAG: YIP1 family protein [Rhodovulum sulfidophilum]|uniref:YIP1 family protein n=1 Tax=Rhodovulum sulfidophilum TaxID=35806 RepID=A0A2W5N701_RHOSU|nr:MAG: YIP1 family protein [Rhodovulum sulfidophilum]
MRDAAPEGLVATMARAYHRPRAVMARLLASATEGRALAWLFIACALAFVASVPAALTRARDLGIEDPVAGVIAAHLFAYLFVAPLVAYGFAALAHLLARAFGAAPGFLKARVALFWALLLAAPLALLLAALRVVAERLGAPGLVGPLGWAALAFWLWLFAAGFAEAEKLGATWQVGVATALVFALVATALSLLTRGAPVAG